MRNTRSYSSTPHSPSWHCTFLLCFTLPDGGESSPSRHGHFDARGVDLGTRFRRSEMLCTVQPVAMLTSTLYWVALMFGHTHIHTYMHRYIHTHAYTYTYIRFANSAFVSRQPNVKQAKIKMSYKHEWRNTHSRRHTRVKECCKCSLHRWNRNSAWMINVNYT